MSDRTGETVVGGMIVYVAIDDVLFKAKKKPEKHCLENWLGRRDEDSI